MEEDKLPEPSYHLPGVLVIIIKPKTQKQMHLAVGDDVTSEKPFKLIEKSALLDHIQNVEDSDFLPIKAQIEQYPGNFFFLNI